MSENVASITINTTDFPEDTIKASLGCMIGDLPAIEGIWIGHGGKIATSFRESLMNTRDYEDGVLGGLKVSEPQRVDIADERVALSVLACRVFYASQATLRGMSEQGVPPGPWSDYSRPDFPFFGPDSAIEDTLVAVLAADIDLKRLRGDVKAELA